jgi:MtN3 and saliva related transmembrane protein
MPAADWIGYLAATCTTISFIPQAVKALREGDTHSLSLGMYVLFTAGVVLWALYGYSKGDWAIVVANLITGSLSAAILAVKIRNDVAGASGP